MFRLNSTSKIPNYIKLVATHAHDIAIPPLVQIIVQIHPLTRTIKKEGILDKAQRLKQIKHIKKLTKAAYKLRTPPAYKYEIKVRIS